MRRIAIVGSGISGLLAAHDLLRHGYQVTLYSDRTADAWRDASRPTGTAARFELALAYERELGLNDWEQLAPTGEGVHLTFCPALGNRLLTLTGRLTHPFRAIDVRLQSHRWMNELAARGGNVVVEAISVARLSEVAAESDLTLVAVGRGELAQLFERDPARCPYDRPQRQLTMIVTRGGPMRFDGIPLCPVKFNFFAPAGECFWIPYWHKDHGATWNMLVEAKAGGPFDRFRDVRDGETAVERVKALIREHVPWDWPWAKDMTLADPQGWLVGAITPTVRRPVARLSSGHVVMPLGDTAISLDPIAGQGANCGTKMARHIVDAIRAWGDRPFDAAWMEDTFNQFYTQHGAAINRFTNLLLEPIPEAGKQLLIAQYGSTGNGSTGQQRLANAFIDNFNDPNQLTWRFTDTAAMRTFITQTSERPWPIMLARGAFGVGRAQLRQKLGRNPGHPPQG